MLETRNPSAPASGQTTRFRWCIVALLFLATTICYMDRQILALLKPILDAELGWSDTDYGKVNAAFFGVYAASYAVFGWFIDRFGVRMGYAVSIFWWSLAAISHSLAGSVRGFFCARIALGAGEGGNFPSCIKAIAVWFPKRERAFAASLFNAGANAGPVIAPAIVPWIAVHCGWRMAFVMIGAAGLVWLAPWLWFYTDSPERSRLVSAGELEIIENDKEQEDVSAGSVSWWRLFAHRQTWAFVLLKFLTDPISWFWLIWLPDFFNSTRHLDIQNSWPHLVTIYLLAAVLSIIGGWSGGFLIRRGWTPTWARKTGLLISALFVLPVLLVQHAGNWMAVGLVGLAIAAHQAWCANVYAAVSDVFPKRAVAAIAGIGGCAGAMGGMLFPYIAGILLDHYKTTAGGESAGYAVLFAICPSVYFVALVIHHVLAPRYELVKLDASRK
ncbi:MAG: MFS transporter [Verrucomicrobiota bacterium]|jgi:ACS family hexuronate transporter-like MFS transporter